ncbi:hypothetical protein Ancab_024197 [Ancistrocladus abbreviatus]
MYLSSSSSGLHHIGIEGLGRKESKWKVTENREHSSLAQEALRDRTSTYPLCINFGYIFCPSCCTCHQLCQTSYVCLFSCYAINKFDSLLDWK